MRNSAMNNFKSLKITICITLLICAIWTYADETEKYSDINFTHIAQEKGLSQTSILCMMQDRQGFIWLGTKEGLNRFDGYSFKAYKYISSDTTSLSDNEIQSLSEDQEGNIYVSTQGGGFCKYIYKANTFIRYPELPTTGTTVNCVIPNDDGSIWVGTPEGLIYGKPDSENPDHFLFTNMSTNAEYAYSNGQIITFGRALISVESILPLDSDHLLVGTQAGSFLFHIKSKRYVRIEFPPLFGSKVHVIVRRNTDEIWAGTTNGVTKMRWENGSLSLVELFNFSNDKWKNIKTDWINDIVVDNKNRLWIGTRGGGLVLIDENENITNFYSDLKHSSNIGDNMINSVIEDRTGVLWIGTECRGAVLLDLNRKKFKHLENNTFTGINLTTNQITAITGKDNEIWIGTAFNGLDRIVFNKDKTLSTLHIDKIPTIGIRTSSEIISLLQDNLGQLWIGTQSNNIIRYKNGTFTSYDIQGFAFALHQDRNKDIWIGTWGGELQKIKQNSDQIINIGSTKILSSDKVLSIYDDSFGNLWVGTKGGGANIIPLNLINQGYTTFNVLQHNENDSTSIAHNDIYCITQDSKGNFWIGTGMGLSLLTVDKEPLASQLASGHITFKTYTEKDGLPGNMVFGIHEDSNKNLWISTINGLAMFDSQNGTFKRYICSDGLQSTELHSNASYQKEDGNLFLGGVNGLTFFNPEEITTNTYTAQPIISQLKVLNQQVLPYSTISGKKILDTDISLAKKITLTHKHKEFTIEFSAMHFANISNVKYAYRLLGFNDNWHIVENNINSATYTNLKEGNYIFQVRATNNDGIWSDQIAELSIKIKPPFWRGKCFIGLYIAFIIGLLILFRRYSLIAISEKNKMQIERLERKNLIENTEAKMRFFTNISHEIRSPLSLISNPLHDVIEKGSIDEASKKSLKLVYKNVSRLLDITNQLLQLRRIDKGGIEPHFSRTEISPFVQGINNFFVQKAEQKNIKLNFRNELDPHQELWIDQEMITTSIYNIVSNALKFTPNNGHIDILLDKGEPSSDKKKSWRAGQMNFNPQEWVSISISDSGTGIKKEELNKIFIRFYQTKNEELTETAGSGIGLSIVKEYVDLHLGVVEVSSKFGEGTRISILLPTGNKHIPESQQANSAQPSIENKQEEEITYSENLEKDKLPNILIIDDDRDLTEYLKQTLSTEYLVHLANNGKEGLGKAIDILPDLIITDVMMPEMDGNMLCINIKNRLETSHIPVIILTAKASNEQMIEGYESGADMYVSKPFTIDVLKSQIRQLILSRRQLAEKFSNQTMLRPNNLKISSLDERFLDKLYTIIEDNITESDFDVSEIVKQMNLSHSTVLKKVKALTGKSMVEFIKLQRLKRAAQILASSKLPISEIAYMVGFSDPKYFSKCFSKEFGKTPTEFAANPDKFIKN